MKRNSGSIKLCEAMLALLIALPAAADLAVGDRAPAFALSGSDGETYELDDLLTRHRGVVLAWFPKAFTPG